VKDLEEVNAASQDVQGQGIFETRSKNLTVKQDARWVESAQPAAEDLVADALFSVLRTDRQAPTGIMSWPQSALLNTTMRVMVSGIDRQSGRGLNPGNASVESPHSPPIAVDAAVHDQAVLKAADVTAQPRILIVAGITGAGKSTLIQLLLKRFPERFVQPKVITTRDLRPEDDKEHVLPEKFETLLAAGQLVLDRFSHGAWYAVRKQDIASAAASGQVVLMDTTSVATLEKMRQEYPDVRVVYVTQFESSHSQRPSRKEIRSVVGKRLRRRGGMTPEKIAQRVEEAVMNFRLWQSEYPNVHRIVVNAEGQQESAGQDFTSAALSAFADSPDGAGMPEGDDYDPGRRRFLKTGVVSLLWLLSGARSFDAWGMSDRRPGVWEQVRLIEVVDGYEKKYGPGEDVPVVYENRFAVIPPQARHVVVRAGRTGKDPSVLLYMYGRTPKGRDLKLVICLSSSLGWFDAGYLINYVLLRLKIEYKLESKDLYTHIFYSGQRDSGDAESCITALRGRLSESRVTEHRAIPEASAGRSAGNLWLEFDVSDAVLEFGRGDDVVSRFYVHSDGHLNDAPALWVELVAKAGGLGLTAYLLRRHFVDWWSRISGKARNDSSEREAGKEGSHGTGFKNSDGAGMPESGAGDLGRRTVVKNLALSGLGLMMGVRKSLARDPALHGRGRPAADSLRFLNMEFVTQRSYAVGEAPLIRENELILIPPGVKDGKVATSPALLEQCVLFFIHVRTANGLLLRLVVHASPYAQNQRRELPVWTATAIKTYLEITCDLKFRMRQMRVHAFYTGSGQKGFAAEMIAAMENAFYGSAAVRMFCISFRSAKTGRWKK